jgi:hypothetical protein
VFGLDQNRSETKENHVLDDIVIFLRRFVFLSEVQATVVALWVVHTHAVDAAYTTPYLNIGSAEKQCGKTRLLEVLKLLARKPWLTGRASAAVLVRKIDAQCPTLLLDESDAAFGGEREYAETLRGVLNCGHSREGVTSLCVGQGGNITFTDFRVFCPKAIAGIGSLPDTVTDRSIPIRMRRRASKEPIERFHPRRLQNEAARIRERIVAWVTPLLPQLRDGEPEAPDALSDRQRDGCEPLLAIADAAGNEWPKRARDALVEILTGVAAEDNSIGVLLLADIRSIFDQKGVEKLSTSELLASLCDLNPQWQEYSHGKSLSAASLARLLKRYEIQHRKLRTDGGTPWGYTGDSFQDAFARYLPRSLEQVEQCSNEADKTESSDLEQNANVPGSGIVETAASTRIVPCVPDSGPNRKPVRFVDEMEGQELVPPAHGPAPSPFSSLTAAEVGFGNSP